LIVVETMTKTSLILLSLIYFSIVLIFLLGYYQQRLQYAKGITNSTSTICINGKCTTTMCIDNEPCRTIASNSTTTNIPDNATKTPPLGPLVTV
jgi:hypothetical protein